MNIESNLKEIIPKSVLDKIQNEKISYRDYFNINKENERNILINLVRYLIKNEKCENYNFKDDEIKEKILIKEVDYCIYKEKFFENKEGYFYLKGPEKEKVQKYLHKYEENENSSLDRFKEVYSKLKDMLDNSKYNSKVYSELIIEGIQEAKKIHWKYLPIYDIQMMKNRGCLPEDNIDKYYSHYHAIEDLYKEIIGEGIDFKIMSGNSTLEKEIDFKIYTSRWNGYDLYKISRSIYGWKIMFMNTKEETLKNGIGGLFESLDHDNIFFPKEGVSYALEITWELAEKGRISLIELEERLQDIAEWISDVERHMRVKQPKWCNYY